MANVVSGTVLDADGNPAARTLRAYRRDTGALLGSASSAYAAPVAGDANYNSVVLLLRSNGADGSTTFADESPSPKTITANGNAQVDTAIKKYGSGSLLLDGDGDWLSLADSADWSMGNGDFTAECWAYFLANPASSAGDFGFCLFGQTAVASASRSFLIFLAGSSLSSCEVSGRVYSGGTEYKAGASSQSVALNTWHHFAMCRDGNTLRMYFNGVQIGTANVTGVTITDSGQNLLIGRFDDSGFSYFVNGHMDDVRITKGVCRYPSGTTFTPPASEMLASRPIAENLLGEYLIDTGSYTDEVQIICLDDDAGTLENDLIHRAYPVAA